MLRRSMFGVAMIAIVSATGVNAADAGANGTVRNQAALAVAGRISPQMRAVAQQCAAVVGQATRTPCIASHLAPVKAGEVAVGLGATTAVILGTYEAVRKHQNDPALPVSS